MLTASGTASGQAGDYSWTGSVDLVNFFAVPPGSEGALEFSAAVTNHKQMSDVGLSATPGIPLQGPTCKVCQGDSCASSETAVFGSSNSPGQDTPFTYTFALDSDTAEIAQNKYSEPNLFPECNNDLPVNGAHGLFQWGPLPATENTAPDPNSAR